jgi:hypothetical protein
MDLPRFTSGRVGKLDFSHINEVFDFVEEQTASSAPRRLPRDNVILARLISTEGDTGNWAWQEIAYDEAFNVIVLPDGLSSSFDGNPIAYPARAPGGGAFVNAVVALKPWRRTDGALFYLVLNAKGTTAATFRITTVYPGPSRPDVWSYGARMVDSTPWQGSAPLWSDVSSYEYQLMNGCENPSDNLNNIGVGTVLPGGSAERRSIKVGTVVTAIQSPSKWFAFHFAVPNGYAFSCQ